MKTEGSVAVPTRGHSVRKQALEVCLTYHQERLAYCLGKNMHGQHGAEGHERCIKWLTLALEEEACGLFVTRELHVGYYLNESLCNYDVLGTKARSAHEYHALVLEAHEREVLGHTQVIDMVLRGNVPTGGVASLTAEGRKWA